MTHFLFLPPYSVLFECGARLLGCQVGTVSPAVRALHHELLSGMVQCGCSSALVQYTMFFLVMFLTWRSLTLPQPTLRNTLPLRLSLAVASLSCAAPKRATFTADKALPDSAGLHCRIADGDCMNVSSPSLVQNERGDKCYGANKGKAYTRGADFRAHRGLECRATQHLCTRRFGVVQSVQGSY